MKTNILNYRVIIEKESSNEVDMYVAHVPTLGIADQGKSIDEALRNVEKAVKLYIDTLLDVNEPVPEPDTEHSLITMIEVPTQKQVVNFA